MPIGMGGPAIVAEVVNVSIIKRRIKSDEGEAKIKDARRQVDSAVLKMTAVLDRVQLQADLAKEELDERRAY